MTIAITDRQHKLTILKKYETSKQWKNLVEEFETKRKAYGDAVLEMYGLPDEYGDEFREVKKYNDKNKAIWACENFTEFKNKLGDSEAEILIKENLDEKLKNAEDFIRYSHGTSLSTFRSATDVEFTETDKLSVKANLMKDNIKIVELLIAEYSKEDKTKTKLPETIEDNSDLED